MAERKILGTSADGLRGCRSVMVGWRGGGGSGNAMVEPPWALKRWSVAVLGCQCGKSERLSLKLATNADPSKKKETKSSCGFTNRSCWLSYIYQNLVPLCRGVNMLA